MLFITLFNPLSLRYEQNVFKPNEIERRLKTNNHVIEIITLTEDV